MKSIITHLFRSRASLIWNQLTSTPATFQTRLKAMSWLVVQPVLCMC